VRVLTGGEQLAEDLLDGADIIHLVAGDRRQGLVEHRHTRVDPITVDQARAEVGERGEFEIGVTVAARNFDRLVETLLLPVPVRLEHPGVQRDPPALGVVVGCREQRAGPRQPAAHHRDISVDLPVHAGKRAGHPHRAHRVRLSAVGRVRPLPEV
jgi:hypothetical protein